MRAFLSKLSGKLGAKLRGVVSRSKVVNVIFSEFDWFRDYIGGTWAHYFVMDGLVSIWDHIPEGMQASDIIDPVHYALYFETHEVKPLN